MNPLLGPPERDESVPQIAVVGSEGGVHRDRTKDVLRRLSGIAPVMADEAEEVESVRVVRLYLQYPAVARLGPLEVA